MCVAYYGNSASSLRSPQTYTVCFTAFKPKPCGAVKGSAVPGLRSRIIEWTSVAEDPLHAGL